MSRNLVRDTVHSLRSHIQDKWLWAYTTYLLYMDGMNEKNRIANAYIRSGRVLGRAKRHPFFGMPSGKSDRAVFFDSDWTDYL